MYVWYTKLLRSTQIREVLRTVIHGKNPKIIEKGLKRDDNTVYE